VLFLVLLVVTYDLTHQALPAGGIEAPEGAAAADGWVATMDNRSGVHVVVLNDLAYPDVVLDVAQPTMGRRRSGGLGRWASRHGQCLSHSCGPN